MKTPPPIEEIEHRYAGVFLITNSDKVVGQKRDNIPTIDNPNKVSTFGGTIEVNENPLDAVWRELVEEETNLKLQKENFQLLLEDVAWRELTREWEIRYFYYAKITDQQLADMEVYEGQGWAYITSPDDPNLIALWRDPARELFKKLELVV